MTSRHTVGLVESFVKERACHATGDKAARVSRRQGSLSRRPFPWRSLACSVYDVKRSPISVCGKGCSMITAVDLHRDLAGLPMLQERYGHPTDEESLKSFATLAAYRDGGIFATHFRGSSGWERHPHGDEVGQILEGATRL